MVAFGLFTLWAMSAVDNNVFSSLILKISSAKSFEIGLMVKIGNNDLAFLGHDLLIKNLSFLTTVSMFVCAVSMFSIVL